MRTTRSDYMGLEVILAVSVELASAKWKVALHDGRRKSARVVNCAAESAGERFAQLLEVIAEVRRRWTLGPEVPVVVGYEAGQDGFWLVRALAQAGLDGVVIDPASIPVERHGRRRKTDRLDAIRLVLALRRWLRGEQDAMRAVQVPAAGAEDQRGLVRERRQLQKERNQHRDRVRKLLRTQGCWEALDGRFLKRLQGGQLRDGLGQPLKPVLNTRLEREWSRLERVEAQLQEVESALLAGHGLNPADHERARHLMRLRSVGPHSAIPLVVELFWRKFNNRRELGSCVGLVGQPYDSGDSRIDQGISKQGRRQVRALLIELAWLWLRWQPESELSQWFRGRTEGQGKRMRRVMIVAMARKLVIALWRYLEDGVVPAGARLKPAVG